MAQRIKIGIPYYYNIEWIAGSYYIINIIENLKLLTKNKKPHIIIYTDSNKTISILKQIGYPYISFRNQKSVLQRIGNKLSRILIKKKIFERQLSAKKIDILFPASDGPFFRQVPQYKRIYWIPDLQEHFLPQFFSKKEISFRKQQQQTLIDKKANIIFSSNSVQSDFLKIYPYARNKTYVLPFAVSHSENYKKISLRSLAEKYDLSGEYYYCGNQFWAHKNHITVLKALTILKKKNKSITVVFSGKESDHRNPLFFESLMEYVSDNSLKTNTRFLGFIDRSEQLALIKNSKAVIQPSLFEGWSTVVEDSKSLNKYVILSDIPVHREQIDKNVCFFDPLNEMQLAGILENLKTEPENYDYLQDRIRFAEAFYSILSSGVK